MSTAQTLAPAKVLSIDFLYLDLDTCTRCRATDATLLQAIEVTRPALDAAGVTVRVTKSQVSSEAEARRLGFVSSPTIRIDGVDIAGELVESACDCSESCPCDGGVDCRDWLYRGERSTEPPVGLIVAAIIRHASGTEASGSPSPVSKGVDVPENLRRYFAASASKGAKAECCAPDVQAGCCTPDEKESCCRSGVDSAACACNA